MRTIIQSTAISILLVFSCVLFGASTGVAFTTYMILDPSQYEHCSAAPGNDCENDPYGFVSAGSTLDVIMYFDTEGEADIAILSVSVLFDDDVLAWDQAASSSPTYALYNAGGRGNVHLAEFNSNMTFRAGTSDQILLDWGSTNLPDGTRDQCGAYGTYPAVPGGLSGNGCGFRMAVLKFNVIESFAVIRGTHYIPGFGGVFTLSNSSPGNLFELSDGSNPENHLRIVPQPTTALLFGLGLVGLSMSQRRGSGR
jgi:hypothetical protein